MRGPGVEDPRDLDLQSVLSPVIEEQRLRATLTFIITRTRADRVDVAPVIFGLGMDARITVDSHNSEKVFFDVLVLSI
jgi:hypothetical protein